MHLLFSAYHQSENPFPAFLFVANFYSSLINMPIIHIEEIETSLLTPVRLATPVLWLSLLTSQLNFQFPITSLLKIFVRSCRDWKEKMPGRTPTTYYLHYFFMESMWQSLIICLLLASGWNGIFAQKHCHQKDLTMDLWKTRPNSCQRSGNWINPRRKSRRELKCRTVLLQYRRATCVVYNAPCWKA